MNKQDKIDRFADHWSAGNGSKYVTQLHPCEGKDHTLAVIEQPAGSFPDPGFDEFNIQLVTKGSFNGRIAFGGESFGMRGVPGTIVLAPPNVDQAYELDGAHSFIALAVYSQTLQRFDEQCDLQLPTDFGQLHSQAFFDPLVEALIMRMLDHAMLKHPASQLFLDDATNTILSSLFHRQGSRGLRRTQAKPLSSAEIQKVSDLIDDRIEDALTIAELASVTCLSDYHFARAFKAATNLSPHQFVLRRRIARAKDLLTHSDLPLAQLAAAAGFSSQSHLTDVFRQKVGTTPGKFRKDRTT